MRLDVLVIELKNERETYLVTPQMALALAAEAKPVRLYTCLPRVGGGIFLGRSVCLTIRVGTTHGTSRRGRLLNSE